MKVFIALFAVVALANAEWVVKSPEQVAQSRIDCIKELSVPQDIIAKIKQFQYPDEEVVRCYIRCTSEKLGIWNDETGFNADHVITQLAGNQDKASLKADVENCLDKNVQGSDKCTWAYRNFQCFIKNNLILVKSQITSS